MADFVTITPNLHKAAGAAETISAPPPPPPMPIFRHAKSASAAEMAEKHDEMPETGFAARVKNLVWRNSTTLIVIFVVMAVVIFAFVFMSKKGVADSLKEGVTERRGGAEGKAGAEAELRGDPASLAAAAPAMVQNAIALARQRRAAMAQAVNDLEKIEVPAAPSPAPASLDEPEERKEQGGEESEAVGEGRYGIVYIEP